MVFFSSKRYEVYDGKRLKNSYDVRYVKISNRVIGIDDQTFLYFKNMGEVIIPKSVEFIGKEAFKGCESLIEAIMPDSIYNVGNGVYSGCLNLRKVRLSEILGNVSEEMFEDCKVLTYIGIPKSVKSIGNNAFKGCASLEKIVLEGEQPPTIYENIIADVSPNCKFYVPESALDRYRAEDKWHDMENYIRVIDKEIVKLFRA